MQFLHCYQSCLHLIISHTHQLIKEGKVRRKKYFVLADNNQLRYYRTEDTRQPVSGNIYLNRSAGFYHVINFIDIKNINGVL